MKIPSFAEQPTSLPLAESRWREAHAPSSSDADPTHRVEVRDSPVHGRGVFATSSITRRSLVGVYDGVRCRPEEVPEAVAGAPTYLFALSDGTTIDGCQGGNFTRFINHSCRPNCEAVEACDEDDVLQIEIRAKRSLRAGEELFIDYALIVVEEEKDDYPCSCGSTSCRGSMIGADPDG